LPSGVHTTTLIIVLISAIGLFICLVYGLADNGYTVANAQTRATDDTVVASDIEYTSAQVKEKDAKDQSKFRINNDFVDPENHCEFCPRIEYSAGPIGQAGIAYKTNNILDLTDAKRVVFFARGEKGGEKVTFVVAGKNTTASAVMQNLSDVFSNQKFGAATQDISLANGWKRYEIDLTGTNLKDINFPFGFIIKGKGSEKMVFYLKGVTYDSQPAQNSLPTIQLNKPPVANAGQNQTVLASGQNQTVLTSGQNQFQQQSTIS
jgi:hypothetical protein